LEGGGATGEWEGAHNAVSHRREALREAVHVHGSSAERRLVGDLEQGRRGSGKRQNGLVGIRRSSRREESGNGGARLGGLLGEAD